jgi:hypothetical protein
MIAQQHMEERWFFGMIRRERNLLTHTREEMKAESSYPGVVVLLSGCLRRRKMFKHFFFVYGPKRQQVLRSHFINRVNGGNLSLNDCEMELGWDLHVRMALYCAELRAIRNRELKKLAAMHKS